MRCDNKILSTYLCTLNYNDDNKIIVDNTFKCKTPSPCANLLWISTNWANIRHVNNYIKNVLYIGVVCCNRCLYQTKRIHKAHIGKCKTYIQHQQQCESVLNGKSENLMRFLLNENVVSLSDKIRNLLHCWI